MKQAIMAAFRKEHPEYAPEVDEEGVEKDNGVYVKIDEGNGETHIMKDEKDITPPGFGRIAAQTARQVIIQKIREAEKKTVSHITKTNGLSGSSSNDMNNVYVDIGKTEAVFLVKRIRNETYIVNNNIFSF
jgi:N utilization substance protein A